MRWSDDRCWVSAACEGFEKAPTEHTQEADAEEIGWQHKNEATFAHAAEVYQRQQHKNAEADAQRVWAEPGNSGDQSAHARRDTHAHIEQVVDHQRGGGREDAGHAHQSKLASSLSMSD